jgi:hypothetical protein
MSRFDKLREFESCFETMKIAELERWKTYWTYHAPCLAPKIRRQAMKRVYEIEKAIEHKSGGEKECT